MKYNLFLFDLDDTLLDFQASEKLCFKETLLRFGITDEVETLHATYKVENNLLWKQLEKGEVDKEFLKVERFKRTLLAHKIDLSPSDMSIFYLDQLPKNVVLIEGATEALSELKKWGEIGIITNGIEYVQKERIKNSELKNLVDFVAVSEECGYAKPDIRFFDYTVKKAKQFSKNSTIVIGDRIDADILGANNFGIDSCWFNPYNISSADSSAKATFVIKNLSELNKLFH